MLVLYLNTTGNNFDKVGGGDIELEAHIKWY